MPGEMVPLHIFEPRYKQLLHDARLKTFFWNLFNHVPMWKDRLTGEVESVIKRYESGESDVIVKCIDLFSLNILLRSLEINRIRSEVSF